MAEKNFLRKWWLEMHCDDNGICYNSIYAQKPPDMNQVREFARKKSIEFAIKRYFDGAKCAKNKRYFYNDAKNLIPEKEYQAFIDNYLYFIEEETRLDKQFQRD